MVQLQPDDDELRFAPPTCANQSLSCQLLVVGGGLSGLSAAEAAMQRGVDVILIERGAFGQEAASALNAGQFLTGWAKPVDVMLDELTLQEQERGAKGKTARNRPGLRKELAAAEAAERLETQLVAGRAQLATVAVAGSVADPQASALARLIGADEATIRTGVALLLAGLIEVGSALGFTLVSVATARNPPPPSAPGHVPGSANTARRHANAQPAVVAHAIVCRVQAGAVATARNPPPPPDPQHVPGPANTARRRNAQHEVVTHAKEYRGPARPVATAPNPPPPSDPRHVPGPANTARRGTNAQHAIVIRANKRRVRAGHQVDAAGNIKEHRFGLPRWHVPPLRSPNQALGSEARRDANRQPTRLLEEWIQARLQVDSTGHIPAREAYADFCRWARAMDIDPSTETRFGREFSADR